MAQGPSVLPGVLQVASALLCPAGSRRPGGTQPHRRDARHRWSVARWTLFSAVLHAPLSSEHPSLHAVDSLSVSLVPPIPLQTRSPTCKAWASWRMSTDRLSYLCLGRPLPGTPKPRSVRPYPQARNLVCSSSFQLVLCRPTIAVPCAYRVSLQPAMLSPEQVAQFGGEWMRLSSAWALVALGCLGGNLGLAVLHGAPPPPTSCSRLLHRYGHHSCDRRSISGHPRSSGGLLGECCPGRRPPLGRVRVGAWCVCVCVPVRSTARRRGIRGVDGVLGRCVCVGGGGAGRRTPIVVVGCALALGVKVLHVHGLD
jgi:hypothetical protein